jgi:4-carboxymuconolactone decarboxylase
MATMNQASQEILKSLANEDAPVLETVAQMHVNTFERSGLDEQTYHLVRLAALVGMDGPPVSYLVNGSAAAESGVKMEQLQGMLTAVAPIVGGPRIAAAAGNILRALGIAVALDEETQSQ